jgi:DNA-binding NarL/FixJ family response regulator
VIIFTATDDNDTILEAFREGASGFLAKSKKEDTKEMVETAEVVEAIKDVLGGGAAMSPPIARRVLDMFAQQNAPRFDYALTDREREVLSLLTKGISKKVIGKALKRSPHTVDTHLRSIYRKLHVNTQTAAVAKALSQRIVPMN